MKRPLPDDAETVFTSVAKRVASFGDRQHLVEWLRLSVKEKEYPSKKQVTVTKIIEYARYVLPRRATEHVRSRKVWLVCQKVV